jgi:hypothetical protein
MWEIEILLLILKQRQLKMKLLTLVWPMAGVKIQGCDTSWRATSPQRLSHK